MYTKAVIEIADYAFAHPGMDKQSVVREFMVRFGKCERTIWSWMKKACAYNEERMLREEAVRASAQADAARTAVDRVITEREEILGILSDIARGVERVTSKGSVVATDAERVRAALALYEKQGWDRQQGDDDDEVFTVSFGD